MRTGDPLRIRAGQALVPLVKTRDFGMTPGLQGSDPAIIVGGVLVKVMEDFVMEEMEDDEGVPYISGSGEGLMDEGPSLHGSARRNEDIALDLMKFVAMTTGYGRTTSSGVGFQGTGSASKPEEYATHLLELYGKCRVAVEGKK
ncbi:MAG: hypothetical protein WAL96_02035 [Candidatus Sulfotelmatobacter sp.]